MSSPTIHNWVHDEWLCLGEVVVMSEIGAYSAYKWGMSPLLQYNAGANGSVTRLC